MLLLSRTSDQALRHRVEIDPQVRCYQAHFSDRMEMRSDPGTVATYLDQHEGWFCRCASPMEVEALDPQAYALTLGHFGNFGFEVEPTIGLRLLPRQERSYRIETVALPELDPALSKMYDVDFQAKLCLVDNSENKSEHAQTWVSWTLDLTVWITLPHVITMLPNGLVQSSGDHLLRQIVRQISRKLTWKVQEDFHATHSLACPPRRRAAF